MELIASVIIIVLIAFTINFLLYKRKKNHLLLINSLFNQFKIATDRQDILEIHKLGKGLLFNEGLTKIHLDYISETVNTHFGLHPNLLELKELVMNKQLFWNVFIPY
jgi:hypothetical protein